MAKNLIIFGVGEIAELAHYYFLHDSDFDRIAAFSVDGAYIKETTFCGLPVVPFEEMENLYDPAHFEFFVALSYSKLNLIRRRKYEEVKSLGYRVPSYISSKATVLNGGNIGENCFILEDNTIQPFVKIGDNVTLWSGNHIGHHSVIGNHTFIASHVVISGGVHIGEQCFVGVNATLRDHLKVGHKCVIGAGVLMLEDAEDQGVYMGASSQRSRVPSSRLRGI